MFIRLEGPIRDRRLWLSVCLLLALCVLEPSAIYGQVQQVEYGEAHCADARDRLLGDALGNAGEWVKAQYYFRFCPRSAGDIIAARWQRPPMDSAAHRAFVLASATMFDERVLVALLNVLRRSDVRLVDRMAALTVAAHYADSTILPRFSNVMCCSAVGVRGVEELVMWGGSVPPHVIRIVGGDRVAGDPRVRLIEVLKSFVEDRAQPEYLAGAARSLFRHWHVPRQNDRPVDFRLVRRIIRDETTRERIREDFGLPSVVQETAETEIWTYAFREYPAISTEGGQVLHQRLTITMRQGIVVAYVFVGRGPRRRR